MQFDEVVVLISETQPRGIFEAQAGTRREVWAAVRSIGQTEHYQSRAYGMTPVFKFILADKTEYEDETVCEYSGKKYRVTRVYITEDRMVELTVERMVGNA